MEVKELIINNYGFVFIENSVDYNFLSFTCIIILEVHYFYFTLAKSVLEMLYV